MAFDDKFDPVLKDSMYVVAQIANNGWQGERIIACAVIIGSLIIADAIRDTPKVVVSGSGTGVMLGREQKGDG